MRRTTKQGHSRTNDRRPATIRDGPLSFHWSIGCTISLVRSTDDFLPIDRYATRSCSEQYGPEPDRRPQNVKPSDSGSPIGHLHICAPSVSNVAAPGSSSRGTWGSASGSAGTARRVARGRVVAAGRDGRGALKAGRAGCDGLGRPLRPRRCTLPMTALRVTPPSCRATWLADKPSSHSFFKVEIRSSDQSI